MNVTALPIFLQLEVIWCINLLLRPAERNENPKIVRTFLIHIIVCSSIMRATPNPLKNIVYFQPDGRGDI
jgi:hypothetical protein